MKTIFSILVVLIFVSSCKKTLSCPEPYTKSNTESAVPKCISEKVENFKKFACNKGASLTKNELNGHTIYAFYPGTCGADMQSEYYDASCNMKCAIGGIAGYLGDRSFCDSLSTPYFKKMSTIWSN